VDQDLLETSRHHVTGGAGTSVTNVGHLVHSLELATHSVVNTLRTRKVKYIQVNKQPHLWSPPVPLDLVVPVGLVAGELLHPLLDNLWPRGRGKSHGDGLKLLKQSG